MYSDGCVYSDTMALLVGALLDLKEFDNQEIPAERDEELATLMERKQAYCDEAMLQKLKSSASPGISAFKRTRATGGQRRRE